VLKGHAATPQNITQNASPSSGLLSALIRLCLFHITFFVGAGRRMVRYLPPTVTRTSATSDTKAFCPGTLPVKHPPAFGKFPQVLEALVVFGPRL